MDNGYSRVKLLTSGAGALALIVTMLDVAVAGTPASVQVFEQVAADASIGAASTIANNWGGHQPRITQHSDGRIRLLYISPRSDGTLNWNLKVRSLTGVWTTEKTAQSTDDVVLLRDDRNDLAYVIAWPNSVPTAYAAPSFNAFRIPGSWQVLAASARHYGNAGIAYDGTVCLKASREANQLPLTSVSNTEYSCGVYVASTGQWQWGALLTRNIGQRHAYDYVFPKPNKIDGKVVALAQRDAHKLAENLPGLTETYVFNGARSYSAKIDTTPKPALAASSVALAPTSTDYVEAEAVSKVKINVPTQDLPKVTAAPTERMQDSFIDSKGRVFSVYAVIDPADPAARTRNIVVTKLDGTPVATVLGAGKLPAPGQTRIYEDASQRLWLLWNNPGSKKTEVFLYRLNEDATGFSIATPPTDLSAAFYPYVLDGPMYIASPRGGNARGNVIHAIFNACTVTYVKDTNIDISTCYNKDKSGLQRVFYARIALPM